MFKRLSKFFTKKKKETYLPDVYAQIQLHISNNVDTVSIDLNCKFYELNLDKLNDILGTQYEIINLDNDRNILTISKTLITEEG